LTAAMTAFCPSFICRMEMVSAIRTPENTPAAATAGFIEKQYQ
jgi:hypothetical protein